MTLPPQLEPKHISLLWAGPERAGEIAAIHQRLFDPAWEEPGVLALLEHPASIAFVAQIGAPKITVGFIMGQIMADESEILAVGVAPELQKRGLGRILVNGLARAAARSECKQLFLEVASDNAAAFALYRGLGFIETGRRKSYYQRSNGTKADALVLKLGL